MGKAVADMVAQVSQRLVHPPFCDGAGRRTRRKGHGDGAVGSGCVVVVAAGASAMLALRWAFQLALDRAFLKELRAEQASAD